MKTLLLMVLSTVATVSVAGTGVYVATEKPQRVTESDGLVFVGRVQASDTVRLTARVSGTVLAAKADEGTPVKKGEVLVRIEDTVYKANLQVARAQISELEARLAQAETEVSRYSAGAVKGGVSKVELDRAVLNREVLKAQLEAAKAKVILCEDDLAHCTIRSPLNGAIGAGAIGVGNDVGPGSGTVVEVFQVDPIDISVAVPEAIRIGCMDQGAERDIEKITLLRADGKPYPIELALQSVSKKVDAATGTVRVTLRGPNPNGGLTPGGYVKLIVQDVFRVPRLAVPMAAIVFEGEERFAYVVVNGKAAKRKVAIGDQSGNLMYVTSGLSEEDDVVVAGVHKLADGMEVMIGKD